MEDDQSNLGGGIGGKVSVDALLHRYNLEANVNHDLGSHQENGIAADSLDGSGEHGEGNARDRYDQEVLIQLLGKIEEDLQNSKAIQELLLEQLRNENKELSKRVNFFKKLEPFMHYKDMLTKYCQANKLDHLPKYEVVNTKGPAHGQIFTIEVVLEGKRYGPGTDTTKKGAEDKAAKNALIGMFGTDS